jgi:hypothetical protein
MEKIANTTGPSGSESQLLLASTCQSEGIAKDNTMSCIVYRKS